MNVFEPLRTYSSPSFLAVDFIEPKASLPESGSVIAHAPIFSIVKMSRNGNGLVHGEGRFYQAGNTPPLPEIEMAAEDYRRLDQAEHIYLDYTGGGIYAEELVGHEGFTGTSALLYHTYAPTTVKSVLCVSTPISRKWRLTLSQAPRAVIPIALWS